MGNLLRKHERPRNVPAVDRLLPLEEGRKKPISKSRQRNERWQHLKANPKFLEALLESVAMTGNLTVFCQSQDIPVRWVFDWMAEDEGRAASLTRARKVRAARLIEEAQGLVSRLLDPTDDLDYRRIDSAFRAQTWLAGRMDREAWGDSKQVEMNVRTTAALHVEAVRQLSQEVTATILEGECESVSALQCPNEEGEEGDDRQLSLPFDEPGEGAGPARPTDGDPPGLADSGGGS